MQLQGQRPYKSLNLGVVDGVRLPRFTLLTGPNGSGKSNLLEAIQSNAVILSELGELQPVQVRLFRLGELLAAIEGPVQASSYKEPWANLYNNVQAWKSSWPNLTPDQIEVNLRQQVESSRLLTTQALDRMVREADKPLRELSSDDFKEFHPVVSGVKDPFAASIAEVFLSYSQRRNANEHAQWRLERKGRGSALTDEDFVSRFGPPPWDLLDETLRVVGLPYAFVPPPEDAETANYEVTLLNDVGVPIKPADLSAGERVLLAIAMSLFTGARMAEAIELPRVLLLDEADASLHPSMVKNLLTVIEEIFVKQHGVRVILSTHSPTTVALAPVESLHVMSRQAPRLRAAPVDEALALLTIGLPTLSVRLENRRQVFVESEYDQAVYQDVFSVLRGRISSDRSAEFIAVGRRDVGGGSEAVKRMVKELRAAGVDTVHGIVDRDNRTEAPPAVHYLPDRHSIENLLLDPLVLGTFLLRERVLAGVELGLPEEIRHFELRAEHAQALANGVAEKLGFQDKQTTCRYVGGFSIEVASEFLDFRGHDLEDLVLNAFPPLGAHKQNLKRAIVTRALLDMPDFVPESAMNLLVDVLSA